jgi:hypothetical protein
MTDNILNKGVIINLTGFTYIQVIRMISSHNNINKNKLILVDINGKKITNMPINYVVKAQIPRADTVLFTPKDNPKVYYIKLEFSNDKNITRGPTGNVKGATGYVKGPTGTSIGTGYGSLLPGPTGYVKGPTGYNYPGGPTDTKPDVMTYTIPNLLPPPGVTAVSFNEILSAEQFVGPTGYYSKSGISQITTVPSKAELQSLAAGREDVLMFKIIGQSPTAGTTVYYPQPVTIKIQPLDINTKGPTSGYNYPGGPTSGYNYPGGPTSGYNYPGGPTGYVKGPTGTSFGTGYGSLLSGSTGSGSSNNDVARPGVIKYTIPDMTKGLTAGTLLSPIQIMQLVEFTGWFQSGVSQIIISPPYSVDTLLSQFKGQESTPMLAIVDQSPSPETVVYSPQPVYITLKASSNTSSTATDSKAYINY